MGDGPEHQLLSKDDGRRKKKKKKKDPAAGGGIASIEIPSNPPLPDATMTEWVDRDKGTGIRKRGAEAKNRLS